MNLPEPQKVRAKAPGPTSKSRTNWMEKRIERRKKRTERHGRRVKGSLKGRLLKRRGHRR